MSVTWRGCRTLVVVQSAASVISTSWNYAGSHALGYGRPLIRSMWIAYMAFHIQEHLFDLVASGDAPDRVVEKITHAQTMIEAVGLEDQRAGTFHYTDKIRNGHQTVFATASISVS
jgi:hypothetical protein